MCVETPGKSAQMSKSQMSRLMPYAIVLCVGHWGVASTVGLWNCWSSCWGREWWFWFSSRSWVCWGCLPGSVSSCATKHCLAGWEFLSSQSSSCQSYLDRYSVFCFDANFCPLVGALGLEEDSFWSRTFRWTWTSVWPQRYKKGRPVLEVLAVRRLLRINGGRV